MAHIFIDADACPVKNEVYRVANRYNVPVTLVSNSWMHTPDEGHITFKLVGNGFNEADDWIAEMVNPNDIVVTADIPLASQCLAKGARPIGHKGKIFTEETIGGALAQREISAQLREHGLMSGGPAPFTTKDRSLFLQQLDTLIHACTKDE